MCFRFVRNLVRCQQWESANPAGYSLGSTLQLSVASSRVAPPPRPDNVERALRPGGNNEEWKHLQTISTLPTPFHAQLAARVVHLPHSEDQKERFRDLMTINDTDLIAIVGSSPITKDITDVNYKVALGQRQRGYLIVACWHGKMPLPSRFPNGGVRPPSQLLALCTYNRQGVSTKGRKCLLRADSVYKLLTAWPLYMGKQC